MRAMYLATRAQDTSRPVLDTSGYAHRVPESDIFDSHDYEQDPAVFAANYDRLADGNSYVNRSDDTGEDPGGSDAGRCDRGRRVARASAALL